MRWTNQPAPQGPCQGASDQASKASAITADAPGRKGWPRVPVDSGHCHLHWSVMIPDDPDQDGDGAGWKGRWQAVDEATTDLQGSATGQWETMQTLLLDLAPCSDKARAEDGWEGRAALSRRHAPSQPECSTCRGRQGANGRRAWLDGISVYCHTMEIVGLWARSHFVGRPQASRGRRESRLHATTDAVLGDFFDACGPCPHDRCRDFPSEDRRPPAPSPCAVSPSHHLNVVSGLLCLSLPVLAV